MVKTLVFLVVIMFSFDSYSGDKLDEYCQNTQGQQTSFPIVFNKLARGVVDGTKIILKCDAEMGNPFAAILLAENYPIFKIDTVGLYSLVNKLAEEGEHRSLAIRGLSNIDPALGILGNGDKPSLKHWYSGEPYNYEEVAKFHHEYYFGSESNASSYIKSKAYAYLHYANELGNEVAGDYMEKLVLKMNKRELLLAKEIIDRKGLIKETSKSTDQLP